MIRPAVVLAWRSDDRLFDPALLRRLERIARVLNSDPVTDWHAPESSALLGEADIVLGHWGCPRLDTEVLAKAPRLAMFAYAAGTVKPVVSDAVFERGIVVTSCADRNAEPVAEFTLAAILMANKNVFTRSRPGLDGSPIPAVVQGVRPVGNRDKTIGLIGGSLVGRRLIELLRPFEQLRVMLYDPYVRAEEARALGVTKVDLHELVASADIVSIHAPELPSTVGMIGRAELAAMRDGATLINTARGRLVDTPALTAELTSGRLSAVLDVTCPEPLPAGHPLRRLPNVLLTPHLAGSEGTELGRLAEGAIDEIERFVAGRPPRYRIMREQLINAA